MSTTIIRPLPVKVSLDLPIESDIVDAAEQELRERVLQYSDDGCYGYFPTLRDFSGIDSDLPASQEFASQLPELSVQGKRLYFNFLRLALVQQTGESPFHLDSDASTALTGDVTTVPDRLVWRLLVNLSGEYTRTVAYVDADPFNLSLESQDGYIHCPDRHIPEDTVRTVTLGPRTISCAEGVIFCSTRLLHTGQDDENGHFVAAFGCEE